MFLLSRKGFKNRRAKLKLDSAETPWVAVAVRRQRSLASQESGSGGANRLRVDGLLDVCCTALNKTENEPLVIR